MVGLFLGSLFCSTDLYVFCANTTLKNSILILDLSPIMKDF